jgi:quinol monooxygenase YgiN
MPPRSEFYDGCSVVPQCGTPQWRKLRGYAFDPILSQQFETAGINEIVFKVPWEELEPGPVGEYIEVIDYDPASAAFYEPVDLDDQQIVGGDGLDPEESNPQFHQQFVYAVAMTTIRNFEDALGRKIFWTREEKNKPAGRRDTFVPRLRIYPHAFRAANAFYSPERKALVFGYFPASANTTGVQLPGGIVFTCLSHDIIAHETTHSLLDTVLPRYLDSTNPDVLAFHEAFADIVALFQHFSFPDVLHHQISKTRGDLASQSLLGELAQQFGQASGLYGGLREAIGRVNERGKWVPLEPDPRAYEQTDEPHERGSILVAALFDSYLTMYRERVADLMRIATGGSGVLPAGALPPDLTKRLAKEASRTAQHLLTMCIRALDYCPPVDITFGDYLRALITADVDLVPEDEHHYRVAIIEAFRRRGIYPRNLRTLSEQSLHWPSGKQLDDDGRKTIALLAEKLSKVAEKSHFHEPREMTFDFLREFRKAIHELIQPTIGKKILGNLEDITGLRLDPRREKIDGLEISPQGGYKFEVHSVRPVRRHGPDGEEVHNIVLSITQHRTVPRNGINYNMLGGCTLLLDLETQSLRYAICKSIGDPQRVNLFERWIDGDITAVGLTKINEPIAHLHLSASL